jgi:thioredoxin-like negative regulator of GroEL
MAKRKPLARADDSTLPPARPPRPAPVPLTTPAPPAHEAVLLFQRGMEALQRHAYAEAAPAFQAIVMGFPTERALLDRARVYLGICERESKKRPASARTQLTLEERLTTATAALNNGEDQQAEELARGVLGDDPKHDLALYLLAAIHARRGACSDALDLLAKVIAISPEACAQARSDEDFTSLHDDDAFWRLTEPPIVSSGNARRRPRGR